MHLDLTGHHVSITSSLRTYVSTKLERLERHSDHLTHAHVVLNVEKHAHKAECTLNLAGATLHADAVCDDMYAAIDALADKLDRQLLRHKEKSTSHHRHEKAAILSGEQADTENSDTAPPT